ncbi:MAG: ATP-binding protein [Janthinobacterium sp.]
MMHLFLAEHRAALEADLIRCTLVVEEVDPLLQLHADQHLLLSAVGKLLRNAFKFGAPNGTVVVRAYGKGERIRIEVEDNGAGLTPQAADDLFLPFAQGGANKTDPGSGLSIARRSVEANGKRAWPWLRLHHRFATACRCGKQRCHLTRCPSHAL